MQIRCIQTSNLLTALTKHCKNTPQIHQLHAQAITRGLFSLNPTSILTQILHFFTLTLSKTTINDTNYPTNIFNLIPSPSTFNYNCIIRAQTLLSSPLKAVQFYTQMRGKSLTPDSYTFPFVLKACGSLQNAVFLAKALHSEVLKFGFLVDVFVGNALMCAYCRGGDVVGAGKVFGESLIRDVVSYNVMIDGFVKAGEIDRAGKLFDEMPERDGVSWGTLLAGYAKLNWCVEAIGLFESMIDLRVKFDNVALVSALSACAQLGELEKGKKIHVYIERNGISLDSYIGTALVDFYAKCGCIEMAKEVFESCREKNVSLWNAMLVGLAMQGNGEMLLHYFSRMAKDGIRPDGVTILGVLVGCSHSGLIDKAKRIFGQMESIYGVQRQLKHYGCMADLLGRAGLIKEAMEMIEEMPMGGDVYVWGGLLGGCKIHGNLEVAEEAAKHVMDVKPEDGGVYSVLAHMYANSQRWDDLVKVRKLRDCRWGIKKSAGCSLIELGGITHEFVSGDRLHPCTEEIYFVLNRLELQQWIEIDDDELARFVEHVDKDNNGIITFEEWRDFLLLYSHEATLENIYRYWERVYLVDIDEHAVIPEGISKHVHATKYLIAGGVPGAASRTATAPLDRIKVILQVQTTHAAVGPAVQNIWKEGGLLGFFRGNGINVLKVAPESAIKFYTYELLKNAIGDDNGDIGTGGRLVAGGLAGAVAQTSIYPMDLVKTRLQTFSCEKGSVPNLGKLTKDIWIQEGPRAFYRGLIPSLLGIIPYAGIDLAAYETLKDMARKHILHDGEPGPLVQLSCGTISGSLGATCVYPLQVVRTRMQAQRGKSSMSDVFWKTYQIEGLRGFYKGLFPNLLKVIPAASITYLVYEAMKKNLSLD